jgi:hypothetical protein
MCELRRGLWVAGGEVHHRSLKVLLPLAAEAIERCPGHLEYFDSRRTRETRYL